MAKPIDVTDATFQEEVLQSDVPVLADFWADWRGPCRMIAPSVKEIASEQDGVLKVAKMDVDENPAVPGRYAIVGIPTLMLFKGGQVGHPSFFADVLCASWPRYCRTLRKRQPRLHCKIKSVATKRRSFNFPAAHRGQSFTRPPDDAKRAIRLLKTINNRELPLHNSKETPWKSLS